MQIKNCRVHIVGSADPEADEGKLTYIHNLVKALVAELASKGALFVVPIGKEPFLKERTDGPSIIFDWSVLETLHQGLNSKAFNPASPQGRLITSIATSKVLDHIPSSRKAMYEELRAMNAVAVEYIEPGWSAGAYRRLRLAQLGDVMIGISGGEGVEHLALEYIRAGKPVIPLDINVGASQRDGVGGAARLFERALKDPTDFIRVSERAGAVDLLDKIRTQHGQRPIKQVVDGVIGLLDALMPPKVFCVRLLNDKIAEYADVEKFFRDSVDPVVSSLGLEPFQINLGKNEFAWMNQAIFDTLHHSAVVLIDLTALRSNCFMELGYALGNKQRVIVTAKEGTNLPFDSSAIETFMWNPTETPESRKAKFLVHWERNINMPPLVRPKEPM